MFIAIFKSNPHVEKIRAAAKPAHDDYWSTRMDRLRLAGPMLTDDGSKRIGQILVIDVAEREAAKEIVESDPYMKAGVFADYSIRRFRMSVKDGKSV